MYRFLFFVFVWFFFLTVSSVILLFRLDPAIIYTNIAQHMVADYLQLDRGTSSRGCRPLVAGSVTELVSIGCCEVIQDRGASRACQGVLAKVNSRSTETGFCT